MSVDERVRNGAPSMRSMRVDDLDQVLAIETESFVEPWTRENFVQEIEYPSGSELTVATIDDAIVGYSVTWYLEHEVHLANVAVKSGYRERGIGRALVEAVMEAARREGAPKIMLEVRESNVEARRLYEHLGFCPVGVKPDYYRVEKEDAILMRYTLEAEAADGESG
jgi:ribosomal-protein-alanine N-acetyltransferase